MNTAPQTTAALTHPLWLTSVASPDFTVVPGEVDIPQPPPDVVPTPGHPGHSPSPPEIDPPPPPEIIDPPGPAGEPPAPVRDPPWQNGRADNGLSMKWKRALRQAGIGWRELERAGVPSRAVTLERRFGS